MIAIYH